MAPDSFHVMAFVDSYSFSHRFNDENMGLDFAEYQEIIHQCNGVNATGLARQFYHFALGCGYSPRSMVEAFTALADEYGEAHSFGYNEKTENV